MMNVTITQAGIEDIEKLVPVFDQYRVFYGCVSDINGARVFLRERFLNLQSIIFMATNSDGVCVGFTQLYPSFSSVSMKKVYILNDLFVLKEYRHFHIATMLIDAAKNVARTFNAVRVTLTTEVTNKEAQSLYEKTGFTFDIENKVYHWFL